MAFQFIKVARDGPVTRITLGRPEVLNALHPPAHHELAEAFDAFAADETQWIAIITGEGKRAFCAGNDLKYRVSEGRQPMPLSGFGGLCLRFDLDKPVIAAVHGLALGGGFELALACDLIVADETAVFALSEVTVGLAALAGGLQRLPRQIGMKAASGIAFTGRRVPAEEALRLGLVNEVTPAGGSVAGALRWTEQILAAGPLAVRAAKQVMQRGLAEPSLASAIANQNDYPAVLTMRASDDAVEGPQAFEEKRPPRWRAQ